MDQRWDSFDSNLVLEASCEGVVAGFDQTIKLRFAEAHVRCGRF